MSSCAVPEVSLLVRVHIILRIVWVMHDMHLSSDVHFTKLALDLNEADIAPRRAHCSTLLICSPGGAANSSLRHLAEHSTAVLGASLGALSRAHHGPHGLQERPKGRDQCAEGCHAENRSQCWQTARDEGHVDLDNGPKKTVRRYADDVVCGHAHDVLLLKSVYASQSEAGKEETALHGGRLTGWGVLLDANDHANSCSGNRESSEEEHTTKLNPAYDGHLQPEDLRAQGQLLCSYQSETTKWAQAYPRQWQKQDAQIEEGIKNRKDDCGKEAKGTVLRDAGKRAPVGREVDAAIEHEAEEERQHPSDRYEDEDKRCDLEAPGNKDAAVEEEERQLDEAKSEGLHDECNVDKLTRV
jgi:hypothetical protein